ncbi:uncharacterized protein LOC142235939 [Haematobia irritans]|uniref:uncharacterized protein LOC142235939 n=1 Tax=Haematobia irritans TaxID=7368 RepID=UPI003F50ABC2
MAARRKFLFDYQQVVSFCDQNEKLDHKTSTVQFLEVQDLELDRRWTALLSSYETFILEDEREQIDPNDINIKKFEDASSKYQVCKAKILSSICERTNHAHPDQSVDTPPNRQYVTSLKLPPCDTPPFEGGYAKWPAFRDIFSAVFGNHPHLSPAQKLYHLRGKTRGEAYDIVKKFELVDSNFELAWEALKNRYENKRILVNQQMKRLFGITSVQNESPKSIRLVQNAINDSIAIFRSYEIEVDNWDPVLIHLASSKISDETLRAWEDSLNNHKELPTWEQMNSFLSKRIEKLETIMDFKRPNNKDGHNSKSQSFHMHSDGDGNKQFCKKCKQNHFLTACKYFKSLSPKHRIQYVMKQKFCLNCLSPHHFKPECTSTKLCAKCNQKHHTLLHVEAQDKETHETQIFETHDSTLQEVEHPRSFTDQTFLSTSKTTKETYTLFTKKDGTTILPTAIVHVAHCGELFAVRALLDSGSERSFITTRIQQKLRIPLYNHNSQVSGLGGTVVSSSKGKCRLKLQSRYSNFHIGIEAVVVSRIAHLLPSRPIKTKLLEEVKTMNLADPLFYKPAVIDMIIGSDYLPLINKEGVKMKIGNGIEARESEFGWYLSGPAESDTIKTFSTVLITAENTDLCEQLRKFWEIEEIEKPKCRSENDLWCEEFYEKTTYRSHDNKYVVRLPFKKEYPNDIFLGPSRNMAFAQYCRMEKNLMKTPELKQEYENVLREYNELGHMIPTSFEEEKSQKVNHYFLPHHAVVRPDSKTTRVRVVFNASKKTSSGHSLNNILHAGPILQRDLMHILLNWRYYQFVFNGDIQKMYRQIWIHEEDQPYQQILFRTSVEKPISVFKLQTVTFGVNAAPFLAIRTLLELSKDCKTVYPEASKILQEEVYVDDILSGGHSLEETKQKQKELISALESAGFPLKKLTANNRILLENWPREDLLSEEFLKIDDYSCTKTLGIRWNAIQDNFYYTVEPIKINSVATKRQILSSIAKLFDPLGWLGPTIVIAKILMQDIWEEKTGWDENVSPSILTRWTTFSENLQHISEVKIPRWVKFSPQASTQIHGFSDASQKAYCAAIYVRTVNIDGKIESNLLVAKTKVAPIKRTTIPKLELCAALLLTKLIENVTRNFHFPHEIFLWTDSSIVLGWLQKSPQTLKTFVANRISEILSIVRVSQWNHVKSEDNPADLGSRGCIPQNLSSNPLWWHGAPWLSQPVVNWPKPRDFDPVELESKIISSFQITISVDDIICRFSNLNRCLRVISYIFRFFKKCRKMTVENQDFIQTEEIVFVKHRLILLAQQTAFIREIECLIEKRPISRKSSILSVNPFLDNSGLLRVGGRLSNSSLNYDEKHPVILPGKSKLAELIILFTHQILLHSEHHTMLRALRQGYYIPRVKNLIRKCIRNCKTCTIVKHRFQNQIMADLPIERVRFSLPFTYTGVDFAGPFNIRSSPIRNSKILKSYAAVFVCFVTKAVHLELCSELSADAFIATFTRFVGRRGLPKTMYSDNGRNFIGASYKLLKEHEKFLKSTEKSLVQKYATHGFSWSFIPPYAPHMGGLWESAVKIMKIHLKKVTTNLSFTYEEFNTLLIKIEGILNSRPLAAMSANPQEINALTPGHFLRGSPIIAEPEITKNIELEKVSLLNRWERLKELHRHFAQRWKHEYITELQRRAKWKTTKNNVQVNDLVIVKDDMLPSTEWRLGRITKVFCGNDNQVRVAEIYTQNGLIRRPIVKLCVLPIENSP